METKATIHVTSHRIMSLAKLVTGNKHILEGVVWDVLRSKKITTSPPTQTYYDLIRFFTVWSPLAVNTSHLGAHYMCIWLFSYRGL